MDCCSDGDDEAADSLMLVGHSGELLSDLKFGMNDDYLGDDDPDVWLRESAQSDCPYEIPEFQSGKWYRFSPRHVSAYPAGPRTFLSVAIQGTVTTEVLVGFTKFVDTLDLCKWFPSSFAKGVGTFIEGVEGVCDPEDICIFAGLPPEHERISGALWIAFALHKSDVSDFMLDQAR